jgi:hypothetical protein
MFTTAPLFGRFHSGIKPALRHVRAQPLHHLEGLLTGRLDPALLAPNPSHANSRQRDYPPKLAWLAFLDQTLNPDASCRSAVRQIQAYHQVQPVPRHVADDPSAYCQARGRWTLPELTAIRRDLAGHTASEPLNLGWGVLPPVKLVDGTCLNLPDTLKNRRAYPQSSDQKPGCGFPLLRLTGVFSLATGALLEREHGPYTTSENELYQRLWPTFQQGDLVLGDRNFGAWGALASLQAQQVDGLFRLHASRNADFRRGVKLGPNDRLVTWAKPRNQPAQLTGQPWAALPATLTVRLIRFAAPTSRGGTKKIVLVTTLRDPLRWPVQRLAALYARRWQVELNFDDLKTTLHMDMLSCRTPAMIHKELEMHLIAYNLIRSLQGEAAVTCHVPLARLSFKGCLDTATRYSQVIAQLPVSHRKRRRALYAHMLAVMAADQVPARPGRFEPRCRKRRPKPFPLMTQPRRILQAAGVNHIPNQKPRKA